MIKFIKLVITVMLAIEFSIALSISYAFNFSSHSHRNNAAPAQSLPNNRVSLPNSHAALPNAPVSLPNQPVIPNGSSSHQSHFANDAHTNDRTRSNRHHVNRYLFYPYDFIPTFVIYGTPDDNSYVNYTTPDTTTPNAPVPSNIQAGPNQSWIDAQNGQIPDNALVYQTDDNGNKLYFCQVEYNNAIYQGVLVVNDACYVQEDSTTARFTNYQVLVQSQ